MRAFWLGLIVGGACGAAVGFVGGRLRPDAARLPDHAESADGATATPTQDRVPGASRRHAAPPPLAPAGPGDAVGSGDAVLPGRAASTTQPAAAGEPGEEPGPHDGWTPEQFLAELRRAAGGHPVDSTDELVKVLFEKHPKAHVPLSLALALVAAERSFNYGSVANSFTEGELHAVLRRGVMATWGDVRSWALVGQSAETLHRRSLAVDRSVVNGLLTNEVWRVRSAGIRLAESTSPVPRELLEQIARSDPHLDPRLHALDLLIELAEREEKLPSDDVVGLVERALREGELQVRREAAELVPRLGRPGAAIALDLLTTQAFSPDSWDARPLVDAVVRAGMGARLLEYSSTGEVLRVVGSVIDDLEGDEGREQIATLRTWLDDIGTALSEGEVDSFYGNLAHHGFHEPVARAATDPHVHGERRRVAFEALFSASTEEGDPVPSFPDVAERVARDETAPVELRVAALDALNDVEETSDRAYVIRRGILLEHAPPVALRAQVVEQLTSDIDDDTLDRRLPEILEILDAVAANDPSSWVRAVAAEQREAWKE